MSHEGRGGLEAGTRHSDSEGGIISRWVGGCGSTDGYFTDEGGVGWWECYHGCTYSRVVLSGGVARDLRGCASGQNLYLPTSYTT